MKSESEESHQTVKMDCHTGQGTHSGCTSPHLTRALASPLLLNPRTVPLAVSGSSSEQPPGESEPREPEASHPDTNNPPLAASAGSACLRSCASAVMRLANEFADMRREVYSLLQDVRSHYSTALSVSTQPSGTTQPSCLTQPTNFPPNSLSTHDGDSELRNLINAYSGSSNRQCLTMQPVLGGGGGAASRTGACEHPDVMSAPADHRRMRTVPTSDIGGRHCARNRSGWRRRVASGPYGAPPRARQGTRDVCNRTRDHALCTAAHSAAIHSLPHNAVTQSPHSETTHPNMCRCTLCGTIIGGGSIGRHYSAWPRNMGVRSGRASKRAGRHPPNCFRTAQVARFCFYEWGWPVDGFNSEEGSSP